MARKPKAPISDIDTNPPTEPNKPKGKPPARRYGGFTKGQWIFVGVLGVVALWGLELGRPKRPAIEFPTVAVVASPSAIDQHAESVSAFALASETPTAISVIVQLPTATITETPPPLPTDSPVPPTVAAMVVQAVQPSATFIVVENDGLGDVMVFNPVKTFYAGVNGAKLRGCPNRTCEVVASLLAGDQLIANGAIDGEEVEQGNKLWYRTQVNGQTLYAFSGILDSSAPSSAGSNASGGSSSSPTMSQPVVSGGSCPNISATCGQLNSCDQARACLAAGNGSLDSDKDGIPCESICGG